MNSGKRGGLRSDLLGFGNGFNEARAMNSGKQSESRSIPPRFCGFNEARAMNSGKLLKFCTPGSGVPASFNEARAMNSGKPRACAAHPPCRAASMRPEQ